MAPALVGEEGAGDLRQRGRRLDDARHALKDALVLHDAPHLHARLEVTRLLQILLLCQFGPNHPTGDHRVAPPVHVDPHNAHPLQLVGVGAPPLGLVDFRLRRSTRWTRQQKSTPMPSFIAKLRRTNLPMFIMSMCCPFSI